MRIRTSIEISREEYNHLQPRLVARFRALGASLEEARDLSQEVFLQACQAIESFEGRSELGTWVFAIAKRVWLNHLRSQRAQKRQAERVSLDSTSDSLAVAQATPGLENRIADQDLLERVTAALHGFSEELREPLVLSLNGFKYREIAMALGISEGRVASLIFEARSKLRRKFGQ